MRCPPERGVYFFEPGSAHDSFDKGFKAYACVPRRHGEQAGSGHAGYGIDLKNKRIVGTVAEHQVNPGGTLTTEGMVCPE
jgi:hypothetical protein